MVSPLLLGPSSAFLKELHQIGQISLVLFVILFFLSTNVVVQVNKVLLELIRSERVHVHTPYNCNSKVLHDVHSKFQISGWVSFRFELCLHLLTLNLLYDFAFMVFFWIHFFFFFKNQNGFAVCVVDFLLRLKLKSLGYIEYNLLKFRLVPGWAE